MRPHVQHVALEPIDRILMLLKLARLIPSDESRFENDLLDDTWYSQRWDMGIVCMRLALSGYGPLLWVPEGSVGHQDHRLVGGGTVTGHGYYLLCHLINIDLGEKEKMFEPCIFEYMCIE